MDIAEFRDQFPEFADDTVYTDGLIEFWSGIAETFVRKPVWCNSWMFGVKLYTAHEITLAVQNVQSSATGSTPGQQGGVANSKAVGAVNVAYDASTMSEKDAGFWNLTTYGKQFIRLARMFGAGAIQL